MESALKHRLLHIYASRVPESFIRYVEFTFTEPERAIKHLS